MTFGGKKYETSSRLKSTPPIGAPKATATPAALAALKISRRFPRQSSQQTHFKRMDARAPTFIILVLGEVATDDVTDAAGYVNEGALFAEREAARNGISLQTRPTNIGNVHTMQRSGPTRPTS